MVEDRALIFEDLVDAIKASGPFVRLAEFLLRAAIISIVTFKVGANILATKLGMANPTPYNLVCLYLIMLYSALLLWSVLMYFGVRRAWRGSYGGIAIWGLLGALLLTFLGEPYYGERGFIAGLAALALTGLIWRSLILDVRAHGNDYLRYVIERFAI
jgi:hypothetical protein